MGERFTRLFLLPVDLYAPSSPLIVKAGALLKDTLTQKLYVQLKFQNVQEKAVKYVKIAIQLFDVMERRLGEEIDFEYIDFLEKRDAEFGTKTLVPIEDPSARSFEVCLTEIGFDDNSVQTIEALWEYALVRNEVLSDNCISSFMLGRWSNLDGQSLRFYKNEDGTISVQYNNLATPDVDARYYSIYDQVCCFTDGKSNVNENVFRFDFPTPNTMKVFCYASDQTITLFKQS